MGATNGRSVAQPPGAPRPLGNRVEPESLVGDRGHSYPAVRRLLACGHIWAVIPRRCDQHPDDSRHAPLDRRAYRERNRVEPLVNALTQYRRVAARSDRQHRAVAHGSGRRA